jgi:hypothetical protein
MLRFAPAIRRISSTVSGSSQIPTTATAPMAVISRTVMNRQEKKASPVARARWTVARAACRTVVRMASGYAHGDGRAGEPAPRRGV